MAQGRRELGQATALVCAAMGLLAGCSGLESTKPLNAPPTFASTPPKGLAGGKAVKPGLTYQYQPAATDKDSGDTVTFRLLTAPANAQFDGTLLRWTPTLDQGGLEQTFVLEASDGKDATKQSWTVATEARTAPTDLVLAPLGTANPVELHPFTWTVTFKDDDPSTVAVTAISPLGATYNPALRTLTWTPPAGTTSTTLQVQAVNNVGLSTQQSLAATVERNKAPVITYGGGSSASVVEGDFFSAPFTVTDPNGDAISAGQVQASVTYQGNVVSPATSTTWDAVNGRATVSWTPALNAAYRGKTVSLNLSASDAFGAQNTLSVPLLVSANQAPTITGDAGNVTTVQAGGFLSHRYTITDPNSDAIDGSTVSATITYLGASVGPAPVLTWDAVAGKAQVTWAPAVGAVYVGRTVTLTLAATDIKGARGVLEVTLTVTP